jgi:hypothetical protein
MAMPIGWRQQFSGDEGCPGFFAPVEHVTSKPLDSNSMKNGVLVN